MPQSPRNVALKRRLLFLGPWSVESRVSEIARAWSQGLSSRLLMGFDCQVLDPPYASEDDIDCRGFWLCRMARQSVQQAKLFRKQSFASLIVVLEGVAAGNRTCSLFGHGQGGAIAALASMPMALEADCRSRVIPTDTMEDYRRSWSGVRAVAAVNPLLLPQKFEMKMLLEAIPELSRTHAAGV
jgi:hypothetical protein